MTNIIYFLGDLNQAKFRFYNIVNLFLICIKMIIKNFGEL